MSRKIRIMQVGRSREARTHDIISLLIWIASHNTEVRLEQHGHPGEIGVHRGTVRGTVVIEERDDGLA